MKLFISSCLIAILTQRLTWNAFQQKTGTFEKEQLDKNRKSKSLKLERRFQRVKSEEQKFSKEKIFSLNKSGKFSLRISF